MSFQCISDVVLRWRNPPIRWRKTTIEIRKNEKTKCITSGLTTPCRDSLGTAKSFLKVKEIDPKLITNTKGNEDNFEVVYKLPWIKHFRFISRVKIIHVGIVTGLTWPMCYWYSQDMISTNILLTAVSAAAATTLGLVVLSYLFRRVVGQLSVNCSSRTVVISTLSFWGNRRNAVFPVDTLTPLSDSGLDSKRVFQRLEIAGTTQVFLIALKHGKIHNDKAFCDTVGIQVDLDDVKH